MRGGIDHCARDPERRLAVPCRALFFFSFFSPFSYSSNAATHPCTWGAPNATLHLEAPTESAHLEIGKDLCASVDSRNLGKVECSKI